MKAWWLKTAERIDQLSQRERIFMFLSVLVVMVAVVDTLWLSPALSAQKKLTEKFLAQTAELDRLRLELQTTPPPVDANAAARNQVAEVNAQLDTIEKEITAALPAQDGAELEKILVQFLRRQPGLTLISTGTLNDAPLQSSNAQSNSATVAANYGNAVNAASAGLPIGLKKRGLELRVAGPYPELVRYVKTLEASLPYLRWGTMQLKSQSVAGPGNELSLQVYVLGVQPR